MKVLIDNYTKLNIYEDTMTYPRKFICENCRSKLEYEKEDLKIGTLGCAFIDCPLCGCSNIIDDEDGITLTVDNIEFPTHFYHVSKECGAVDRCNAEEVKKEIKRAIEYFRKNKNEFDFFSLCGNLFVTVHRYEGDESYNVVVSNDLYDVDIPFETEDY